MLTLIVGIGPARGVRLLAIVWLLAISCTSVAWQAPPAELPQVWRDRTLFDAGDVFVYATSESAAEEAVERSRELLAAFAEVAGRNGGKGLVLALDDEDAPLLEDPIELSRLIHVWHAQASGVVEEEQEESSDLLFGVDENNSGMDSDRMLRLVAFGVPRDDVVLGLPEDLRLTAAWIVVLPTQECLRHSLSEFIAAGMEQAAKEEDVGFGERMLMTLVMPMIKSEMNQAFLDLMKVSFLEVLVAGAEPDVAKRAELLRACKDLAGVADEEADESRAP